MFKNKSKRFEVLCLIALFLLTFNFYMSRFHKHDSEKEVKEIIRRRISENSGKHNENSGKHNENSGKHNENSGKHNENSGKHNEMWTPVAAHRVSDVGFDHLCSEVLHKMINGYEELNNCDRMCGSINASSFNTAWTEQVCQSCRFNTPVFINGNKSFVALASYPGSGNSWTRELLESITGVFTGSVYVDKDGDFPGSKRCPQRGGVYIIKTHEYDNLTNHIDCEKMRCV